MKEPSHNAIQLAPIPDKVIEKAGMRPDKEVYYSANKQVVFKKW